MDTPDFDDIYRRYNGYLFNYISTFVFVRESVEDLLQEVFFRWHLVKNKPLEDKAVVSYLRSIAKSVAIDYLRKEKSRGERGLYDTLSKPMDKSSLAIHEARVLRMQMMFSLRDCLTKLEYIVLMTKLVGGYDYNTIAKRTRLSVSTLRRIYNRALKKAMKVLKMDFDDKILKK